MGFTQIDISFAQMNKARILFIINALLCDKDAALRRLDGRFVFLLRSYSILSVRDLNVENIILEDRNLFVV